MVQTKLTWYEQIHQLCSIQQIHRVDTAAPEFINDVERIFMMT